MIPGNPKYLTTRDLRAGMWPKHKIHEAVTGRLPFACERAKFNLNRPGEKLLFTKTDAEEIVKKRKKIIQERKKPLRPGVVIGMWSKYSTPASEKKANEEETSKKEQKELSPPFENNVKKSRKRGRKNYVRKENVTFAWKSINQYKCHFCDYTSNIKKRDNVARHMCCKHGCTILNKKGYPKDYRETLARAEQNKRRKNSLNDVKSV